MDRHYYIDLECRPGDLQDIDAAFSRVTGWEGPIGSGEISATISPHADTLLGTTIVDAAQRLVDAYGTRPYEKVLGLDAAPRPAAELTEEERLAIKRDALAWLRDISAA